MASSKAATGRTSKAASSRRSPDASAADDTTTGATTRTRAAAKAPAKAAAKAPAKTAAKATATKTAAKATPTKAATKKTATASAPPRAARTTAATKATATKAATRNGTKAAALPVRGDEDPWTAAELKAVRSEIEANIAQLQVEIDQAEAELVGLMRDSGDGAGDDQADAGTKTYEREQEMTVANNAREMLLQNEHALERMDDGTYGVCESCGKPIGKLRLQAAPRATLCLDCKKRQERR